MKQALLETIINTASYYGRTLSEPVLRMFAEDLEDLPISQVIEGYKSWRRNPKNTQFPLPAQIRGLVAPEVDADSAAKEIAGRITGSVTKFGWNNSQKAREFIGETGWAIVERQGGWMHLCENLGRTINPSAFQAQTREQAKSSLTFAPEAMAHAIGIASSVQRGEIQSIGELLKLIPKKEES